MMINRSIVDLRKSSFQRTPQKKRGNFSFYIMEYKNDFYQLLILWKYFIRASYPSDISRTQFEIIRPMLEDARKKTKPKKLDLYDVFCGILYVVKTGCQWRMLPKDYPKWKSGNESGESIFDAALKKAGWQRED